MAAASATLVPPDPETQSEVWGHRRAIRTLQQAVEHGPGHAYILTGPERVGKRTAAFHFAKLLACADRGDTLQPCGSCTSCRRIDRNVFPDVTQFDLARQEERDKDKSRNVSLNITTVRDIAAAVAYRPLESSWRVIIVDDVDTMQETAQEAFLKTLEEPPPYAVILLLTRDADLM